MNKKNITKETQMQAKRARAVFLTTSPFK